MSDIASWLGKLGLDKYVETFTLNEVDCDALRHLDDQDLKDLGLPLGARRKVLAAIGSLEHRTQKRLREAERRQLTVMFVDLVGSTELSRQLDPEEMQTVLKSYQSAVTAAIEHYEGRVAKLMGDGVLAYFGWPKAHEDDAERAVRAGLAAAATTAALTTPAGESLSARIGIATGLVVVGDLIGEGSAQEEAAVGETPNLAARLQALAEPNSVVISGGAHRLVAGLFEMTDLGVQRLKGFATPMPAWHVIREADIEGRFSALHGVSTPLVGRAEELRCLLQCWEKARGGKGQGLLLSGEPGIGKSRLSAAFEERLGSGPHVVLRYFCSPYHMNSALYPVVRHLERAAGFSGNDDSRTKLDRLELLLLQSTSDTVPLLASLLSIDFADRYPPLKLTPQAQKARTLRVLVAQIEVIASKRHVAIVFEDAHWIDPTTAEWLDNLIDELRDLPVFVVVTCRPEFRPRWLELRHVRLLSLDRLGRGDGAAIMERVAGRRTLPPKIREQILARTDGVPLFIEELTTTVLESCLLEQSGDDQAKTLFAIPSTLQDSLMARLDRLASVKDVAQIGACIGRVFNHRLLTLVAGTDSAELINRLQVLEDSGLVSRSGVASEANYTFKHALVQDAAYQSLLLSRRQQIHASIGTALEAHFPDIADKEPETIAFHYTEGGQSFRAGSYWLKAGQLALKRSANVEAVHHLCKGLKVVQALPPDEVSLRHEMHLQAANGVALMTVRGWGSPEVLHAFSSARKLCEQLGDSEELFVAMRGEASYHMISGHFREADELGRRCLQIAQASGDQGLLLEAHHQMWATKFFMGDLAVAEYHANCGIAIYEPDKHHQLTYVYTGHDPGVCCRDYAAMMLWIRGHPDRALDLCHEGKSLAEQHTHSLTMALALATLATVHLLRREPSAGGDCAQRQLDISTQFDLPLLAATARFYLGWSLSQRGQGEEGVAMMRDGTDGIASTGADMGMSFYLGVLAQACGEHGDAENGLSVLDRAFAIVAKSGSKYQLPELLRTKGELLGRLKPNDPVAEQWFRKSLDAAHADGSKSTELRAATNLARLYGVQGRNQDARSVLSPVYDWFTEGFETQDLIEAKQLIDQLT